MHLHLDELVDLAHEYTDKVAERAAAIGVSPDGRSRTVADASTVPAFAEGWARDRDVIRYVYEALDTVVSGVRPRLEDTEKTDLVTQDLLIALVAAPEEARRMWQAQAEGYEDDDES